MAPKTIVFNDFRGGDLGREWPKNRSPNKFRAVNVLVYPNGSIGPRAPFQRFHPITPLPNLAVVFASAINHESEGPKTVAFLEDRKAYNLFTGAASAATATGTLTTFTDFVAAFDNILISNSASTGVRITPPVGGGAPVLSDLAALPASGRLSVFGPFVVAISHVALPPIGTTTIRWSAPNSVTSWPAANFVDVKGEIKDLVEQKNTLVMPTEVVAGLWDILVINGTLSVNATLRRVDQGMPGARQTPYPTRDNILNGVIPSLTQTIGQAIAPGGDIVYWMSDNYLVSFNGSEVFTRPAPLLRNLHGTSHIKEDLFWDADNNLNRLGRQKNWTLFSLLEPDEFIGFLGNVVGEIPEDGYGGGDFHPETLVQAAWYNKGAWTIHDPGISYRYSLREISSSDNERGDIQVLWGAGPYSVEIVVGGNNNPQWATPPKQYRMKLKQEFPRHEDDGDTGSPVTADFRTNEWWSENNKEVHVRGVVVDYTYDATEPIENLSRFFISVEALNLSNNSTKKESEKQLFIPSGTGLATELSYDPVKYNLADQPIQGTGSKPKIRGRQIFRMGDQGPGNGFRIHISDWRGIMIHKIIAVLDEEEARI